MTIARLASQGWSPLSLPTDPFRPNTGVSLQLKTSGGSLVTTYTSSAGAGASTSTFAINGDGSVPRYADTGTYDLFVDGVLAGEVDVVSGETLASVESSVGFHVHKYVVFADPVQEAFDDASAVDGSEVILPEGTWTRSTTLTWHEKVRLRGLGPNAIIHYTGSGHAVQFGSGDITSPGDTAWTRLSVSDVKITGTSAGLSGLHVRGVTRWAVHNLEVTGFTTGAGLLANGCSFIGSATGNIRLKGNGIGLSIQKVVADAGAGESQAGNAVTFGAGCEIQNNGYGVLIGDPAVTEIAPVVAMGLCFDGATIEGNTLGGLWNVSGNSVRVTGECYFEANTNFDIRIGSTSGNTSIPVGCCIDANFIYVTDLGIEILRGLGTMILGCELRGDPASGAQGISIAAAAQNTVVQFPTYVNLTVDYANASTSTTYLTAGASGLTMQNRLTVVEGSAQVQLGALGPASESAVVLRSDGTVKWYASNSTTARTPNNVTSEGDITSRAGDFGQTSQGRAGPGNEAGMLLGTSADTGYYRTGAGHLGIKNALNFPVAITAASAANNSIFRDSADNVIKKKDNAGAVTAI